MHRLYIVAALLAGFLGGAASRFVMPSSVSAQAVTRPTAPAEVRGQRFVLTDPQGNTVATFSSAVFPADSLQEALKGRYAQMHPGTPVPMPPPRRSVVLDDAHGNEIWRAPSEVTIQPLIQK